MKATDAVKMEKNTVTREKSACYNDRRTTDKYWTLLFVVLLIFWIVAARQALIKRSNYHDHDISDDKFDISEWKESHISKDRFDHIKINISYLRNIKFGHGADHVFIRLKRNADEAMRYSSHIWGQNWIFDTITCNSVFLDANYQRSGSIVIWSNVLFCVCLIAYSLASMRTDKMFRALLPVFIFYLMCNALYRGLYYVISILYGTFDNRIMLWVIPESILFITGCTKLVRRINFNSGEETRSISFLQFEFHAIGYILLATPALVFVCAIVVEMYKSNVEQELFYAFFGISCFLGLVIHYFALMVISCAISLSLDFDKQFPRLQDFLRAWFIVVRYHFGTVCYHATLIFPRIHAAVLKKKISDISMIDQFYLTLWKIHDLSFMITAARGCNFSESTKESLKLFTKESSRSIKNCFISHGQIFRCCSTLLVAINSLLIIGLWACGVTFEPHFLMQIWIMYFFGMFFSSVLGRLFDAYVDAHWFNYDENLVMKCKKYLTVTFLSNQCNQFQLYE